MNIEAVHMKAENMLSKNVTDVLELIDVSDLGGKKLAVDIINSLS